MKSRRMLKKLFKDKTLKIAVGLIGTIIVFLGAVFAINPSLFKSILGFSGREFGIDTYKAIAADVPVYTSLAEFNEAKATGFTNGKERAKLAVDEVIAVNHINSGKGYAEIRFLYLTGAAVGIAGFGYVDSNKIVLVEKYDPCENAEYAANNPQLCNIAQLVTVTFVQNNGKPDIKHTVEKGSSINKLLPSIPEKSGYEFMGWYIDEALSKPLEPNVIVNDNLTIYAKWQALTLNYTIRFDVNGGSPVPSNQTVKAGDYITRPTPNPIKVDCRGFVSWNYGDKPWDFTSMKVNDDTVSSTDVTLVANYNCAAETKHTVTFNTNRGVPSQNPIQVVDGGKVPVPKVTLRGYTLVGWKNGNETWDFAKDEVKSSITLSAVWQLNKPIITFIDDKTNKEYLPGTWTNGNITMKLDRSNLPLNAAVQYSLGETGSSYWLIMSGTELVLPNHMRPLAGALTLSYRARDYVPGVGNRVYSDESSIKLNIDKQAPSMPTLNARLCPASVTCTPENATAYTDNTWTNRDVLLYPTVANFGSTDSQSGIAKTQISLGGNIWIDYNYDPKSNTYYMKDSTPFHSQHSDFTTRFIRTIDNAGNISPVKTYKIKIDKTTPAELAALYDVKAYRGPKYNRWSQKSDNGGQEIFKNRDGSFTAFTSTGIYFNVGAKTKKSPLIKIERQYYEYHDRNWSRYYACDGDGIRPLRTQTGIFTSTLKGTFVRYYSPGDHYKRLIRWRLTNSAGTVSTVINQEFYLIRDVIVPIDKRDIFSTYRCPIYVDPRPWPVY